MRKLYQITPLFILALAVLIKAGLAGAGEGFPPANLNIKCSHNTKSFELIFSSASGDVSEDDMAVSIKTTRGETVKLAIKPALFTSRGSVSAIKNICGDASATRPESMVVFPVGKNTVLLWLSSDSRPSYNQLSLALLDIEHGKLIDYLDTKMAIKDVNNSTMLVTRKVRHGYQVRLVGEWLLHTGLDTAETAIESWMFVSVQHGKIKFMPAHR